MANEKEEDEPIEEKEHMGKYAPEWKKELGFEDIPDSELWRYFMPMCEEIDG